MSCQDCSLYIPSLLASHAVECANVLLPKALMLGDLVMRLENSQELATDLQHMRATARQIQIIVPCLITSYALCKRKENEELYISTQATYHRLGDNFRSLQQTMIELFEQNKL